MRFGRDCHVLLIFNEVCVSLLFPIVLHLPVLFSMGHKKSNKFHHVTVLHSSPSKASLMYSTTIRNIGTQQRVSMSHSRAQVEPALKSVQNIEEESLMLLDENVCADVSPLQIPPHVPPPKPKRPLVR